MSHRNFLLCWLVGALWLLAACTPNNVALGPNEFDANENMEDAIEIEAARDEVVVIQNGQQETLPLAELVPMAVGQRVAVDENGRAILHFGDALSMELLQGAGAEVQQFSVDGETTVITVLQNGGTLVADLTQQPDADQRLEIQTAFGTVAATGGRFAVVYEANSPLAWVLGLAGSEGELQVTAGDDTQPIVGGQARWLAPVGKPGPAVAISRGVEAWLNGARNNAGQPALSEILLPPANLLVDAGTITTLPAPGEPFELARDVQGAVNITLDPKGIFGSPTYTLADCNGDGVQDIAIQNGVLLLDFRDLLARVQALNVSLLNRDRPGNGLLQALNPAREEIGQEQVEVGNGAIQILSLRSEQPYHYAELTVSNACLLAVSLTPPGAAGEVARLPAATGSAPGMERESGDVVVNVLAANTERLPQNGQLQAPAVVEGDYAGLIEIDGAQSDWDTLAQQSGVAWTAFSAVTYDKACASRYPDAEELTDLAGRVQLAYDDRYLYAAFVVNDDGLLTYTGDDERYFLGDSAQLLLDLDLNGDFDDTKLSGDDVQVDLLPDIDAPRAALWQLSALTSSQLSEALIAATLTNTGYFVEVALPWQALNVTPQPGDQLGIVASINDNDTPNTNTQECIISTSPQRDWRNPTTWGTVLLIPAS